VYKILGDKGMLFKMFSDSKNSLDRSKLFFDYLEINYPSELDFNSKILIFGSGAGGSTIAYLLAQFGFKNLCIIDKDVVNESDVKKTLIFRKDQIGKSKVLSLNETIRTNFDINIVSIEKCVVQKDEMDEIITREEPCLIIKACDPDLNFRVFLNEICFLKKIPFIHMSYSFEKLTVGPFFIPGKTSCDESINNLNKEELGEDFDFSNTHKLFTDYITHPSISFNINILASLVLKDIVFFFSKNIDLVKSLNALVYFFPITMQSYKYTLECPDNCKTCGTVD